jgi:streptogramin lyase
MAEQRTPPDNHGSEIVGFTDDGSLWFCPGCARGLRGRRLDPARRRDLMRVYTYHCEQCGKPIR